MTVFGAVIATTIVIGFISIIVGGISEDAAQQGTPSMVLGGSLVGVGVILLLGYGFGTGWAW